MYKTVTWLWKKVLTVTIVFHSGTHSRATLSIIFKFISKLVLPLLAVLSSVAVVKCEHWSGQLLCFICFGWSRIYLYSPSEPSGKYSCHFVQVYKESPALWVVQSAESFIRLHVILARYCLLHLTGCRLPHCPLCSLGTALWELSSTAGPVNIEIFLQLAAMNPWWFL